MSDDMTEEVWYDAADQDQMREFEARLWVGLVMAREAMKRASRTPRAVDRGRIWKFVSERGDADLPTLLRIGPPLADAEVYVRQIGKDGSHRDLGAISGRTLIGWEGTRLV